MDPNRRPEHARNPRLESMLQELNALLACSEAAVLERFERPEHPIVFIMGCARSGTTLALQYLAATGVFTYPSNLIARFYNAPYIGARIQQMLTDPDYDFRGELTADNSDPPYDFASVLGKTRGILAPSEFWYFWRRFFPPQEIQRYEQDALRALDTSRFVAEIAALESVRGLPVLMKGMYLNWNIEFLSKLFSKAVFIQIHRDPLCNMQSLLRARSSFFGAEDAWYSFKPPEYSVLCDRPVDEQLAGQVYYTNRAISEGLAGLASERRLVIDYESLCAEPEQLFEALAEKLAKLGYTMGTSARVRANFRPRHAVEMPAERADALLRAYRELSGEAVETMER